MLSSKALAATILFEVSNEPVHFCSRIRLDNGVTLLYDDRRGLAEGSDGKTYFAVCRELPGPEGDMEILGWSAELQEEVVMEP